MSLHEAIVNRAPSLAEQVVEAVQGGIRSGRLVPGELYSVYQLANDLGTSRSPVREALLRLAETGIVTFERNRGFRIQAPGPREIAEVFSVRLALEAPAARLAAVKVTPNDLARIEGIFQRLEAAAESGDELEFMHLDQLLHETVFDIAGNEYAKKIIDNIRSATRLVGASTTNDRTLIEICREHVPIINALRAHDADEAERAMTEHVHRTGRLLLRKSLLSRGISDPAEGDRLWRELVP